MDTYEVYALAHQNAGGYYDEKLVGIIHADNEEAAIENVRKVHPHREQYVLRTLEARKI
jgi:1,2-phenylacetyl-CoA epoxidase PaaB subunit